MDWLGPGLEHSFSTGLRFPQGWWLGLEAPETAGLTYGHFQWPHSEMGSTVVLSRIKCLSSPDPRSVL